MMTARRIGGTVLILILLVGITFVFVDEMRLRRPTQGMSREQVRSLLGVPSAVVDRAEIARYSIPCKKDVIADAYLYRRKWRQSLYVYFNSSGRVECTQRAMSFSIVTR